MKGTHVVLTFDVLFLSAHGTGSGLDRHHVEGCADRTVSTPLSAGLPTGTAHNLVSQKECLQSLQCSQEEPWEHSPTKSYCGVGTHSSAVARHAKNPGHCSPIVISFTVTDKVIYWLHYD